MKQTTLLLLSAAAAFVWYRLGGVHHAAERTASTAEPRLDVKTERSGPRLDLPARSGDTSSRAQPIEGTAGTGLAGAPSARHDADQEDVITPGLPDFARGA